MSEKIVCILRDFVDDLKVVFPSMSDVAQFDLLLAKLNAQTPKERTKLVDNISSTIISHKNIIENRDITKVAGLKLFSDVPIIGDIVTNYMTKLGEPDFLTKKEEKVIWAYMSKMLEMCVMYKKEK